MEEAIKERILERLKTVKPVKVRIPPDLSKVPASLLPAVVEDPSRALAARRLLAQQVSSSPVSPVPGTNSPSPSIRSPEADDGPPTHAVSAPDSTSRDSINVNTCDLSLSDVRPSASPFPPVSCLNSNPVSPLPSTPLQPSPHKQNHHHHKHKQNEMSGSSDGDISTARLHNQRPPTEPASIHSVELTNTTSTGALQDICLMDIPTLDIPLPATPPVSSSQSNLSTTALEPVPDNSCSTAIGAASNPSNRPSDITVCVDPVSCTTDSNSNPNNQPHKSDSLLLSSFGTKTSNVVRRILKSVLATSRSLPQPVAASAQREPPPLAQHPVSFVAAGALQSIEAAPSATASAVEEQLESNTIDVQHCDGIGNCEPAAGGEALHEGSVERIGAEEPAGGSPTREHSHGSLVSDDTVEDEADHSHSKSHSKSKRKRSHKSKRRSRHSADKRRHKKKRSKRRHESLRDKSRSLSGEPLERERFAVCPLLSNFLVSLSFLKQKQWKFSSNCLFYLYTDGVPRSAGIWMMSQPASGTSGGRRGERARDRRSERRVRCSAGACTMCRPATSAASARDRRSGTGTGIADASDGEGAIASHQLMQPVRARGHTPGRAHEARVVAALASATATNTFSSRVASVSLDASTSTGAASASTSSCLTSDNARRV